LPIRETLFRLRLTGTSTSIQGNRLQANTVREYCTVVTAG
jgi:hypothetical protein